MFDDIRLVSFFQGTFECKKRILFSLWRLFIFWTCSGLNP